MIKMLGLLLKKKITIDLKGTEINDSAKIVYCNKCGNEIYIAKLDDKNIKRANTEYMKKLNQK